MELRHLKTFQKVASLLSFNLAADALHYAQSTVSAQIKSLEDDLGVPLFDRLGKTITLTQAGECLLQHSQRVLSVVEETHAAVSGSGQLEGALTIRVPQTIATHYLPAVLAEYQQQYPKVRIELTSCSAYRLAQELSAGAIDLAFLLTETIISQNLHAEMLDIQQIILVTSPEHPLTKKKSASLKDLEGEILLMPRGDCDYPLGLKKNLIEEKIKPLAMPSFNSVEAIKHSLNAGLGVALLPDIAVRREIEAGELSELPWSDNPLEIAVFMIWHRQKWLTPAVNAFLQAVNSKMSASKTRG